MGMAPAFYTRALAKTLGAASIDIEAEDPILLRRLKANVVEALYANDDAPVLRSIRKLADLLADVEDLVEEEEVEDGDQQGGSVEGIAEGSLASPPKATNETMEKENPTRLSVGSIKSPGSAKQRVADIEE